jgi:DUF4097 and DUF4098 domain-containing protein YvlB
MKSRVAVVLFLGVVWGGAAQASDFHWQKALGAGQSIEIKGVNGDVDASSSTGDLVEVTATRSSRRQDPESVKIEVVEHAGGVTISAVYPSRRGRRNTCQAGDGGHNDSSDNDVEVHFVVKVPRQVALLAHTVNGSVKATDLGGDVEAETVNGSVEVSTEGHAEAETVNGSIRVSAGRADWSGNASFRTVNGSITLTLPASASAEVSARTLNGEIETDFGLPVQGKRHHPRTRLDGTIGSGGRMLEMETVNGTIRLRAAK